MSFVRNLYADLMEKRLWPVALGLLVALVAIPVLLAKPAGESASTGTPPTDNALLGADSAALIGETKAVVTVGSDGGFRKHVERLDRKDPFIQQATDKAGKASDGATVEAGDTTGAATTPGETTPGSTAPSGGEEPIKIYRWVAKVKFGKIDQAKQKSVTPGEFMPSENNPCCSSWVPTRAARTLSSWCQPEATSAATAPACQASRTVRSFGSARATSSSSRFPYRPRRSSRTSLS